MTSAEIEAKVWDAIRKTINKFREQPNYFFTESDVVSYLWMSLYSSHLVANAHDGRPVYLVHREYPTNFRYDKSELLSMSTPYPLSDKRGSRGHFDLVVLSPDFVGNAPSIEHIVNKNVRYVEEREDTAAEELLFAIEFKLIINTSAAWENQIHRDNKKLLFARDSNVRNAVNLTFCNNNPAYLETFKTALQKADPRVCAAFIQSHYDTAGVKQPPPRPIANTPAALAQIGY